MSKARSLNELLETATVQRKWTCLNFWTLLFCSRPSDLCQKNLCWSIHRTLQWNLGNLSLDKKKSWHCCRKVLVACYFWYYLSCFLENIRTIEVTCHSGQWMNGTMQPSSLPATVLTLFVRSSASDSLEFGMKPKHTFVRPVFQCLCLRYAGCCCCSFHESGWFKLKKFPCGWEILQRFLEMVAWEWTTQFWIHLFSVFMGTTAA